MIKNIHGNFPDMDSYYTWCDVVGCKPVKTHIHKKDDSELLMHNNYDIIKRRRLLVEGEEDDNNKA